jgi:hypothetical protein
VTAEITIQPKGPMSAEHRAAAEVMKAVYSTRLAELAAKESWTREEGCEIVQLSHLHRILEKLC